MGDAAIQAQVDAVFDIQQSNQFGTERYALAFKPGTYNVDVNVGFYTHVLGLGDSPDDVVINGHVTVDAQWLQGNGTQDFWRAAENLCIVPPDGLERWAVAQAGPDAPRPHQGRHEPVAQPARQPVVQRRVPGRQRGRRPGPVGFAAAVALPQRHLRQLDRLQLEHGLRRHPGRSGPELPQPALHHGRPRPRSCGRSRS